jgi:hypothetical protein
MGEPYNRILHIRNGGTLSGAREGAKFKRMGVRAGFPDLLIPVARKGFNALLIELKRQQGGSLSDAQRDWLNWLNANGSLAVVCKGYAEAKSVIERYISDV